MDPSPPQPARSTTEAHKKNWGNRYREGATQTTMLLMAGDKRELKVIQEILGTGQSDAIRTAIRVYAALLRQQK